MTNIPASSRDSSLLLTDQVVTIRPWRDTDAPELFAAIQESATQVGRWLDWADGHQTVADTQHWIARTLERLKLLEGFDYGLFDGKGLRILGGIGLSQVNAASKLANLGYWVRPSAGRKGIATRAVRLLARHALTQGGFHRLEILTALENRPSQVVAKKVGAQFEGLLRDRIWIRQKCVDAHLFSLTRRDPIAKAI
jgi:RimJ/RimL family protein N-acetyltransferase